jgi:hypothetical protein
MERIPDKDVINIGNIFGSDHYQSNLPLFSLKKRYVSGFIIAFIP